MDRIHIDVMGPLTKTPNGNTYVFVVLDQFIKWIECYPLPEQGAELLAKTLVNEFFSRFGCSLEMHSDQGKKILSKIFVSATRLLQITKTHTTAYRPRSNGQVERSNRTLLQMMRCLRDKNSYAWDEYIPQIASAMRAMVNRDTGFTPNMLMLGHEVFHPVDIMYGVSIQYKSTDTPLEYVKKLMDIMRRSHRIARENLKSNLRRQKRTYDTKLYEYMYNSADLVYLLNFSEEVGMSRKLPPVYKGPYLITKVISPSLYRIADSKNSFVVHHDRLMLCDDPYILFGMRKMHHEFLNLEETMPNDEEEFDPQDPLNRGLVGILPNLF